MDASLSDAAVRYAPVIYHDPGEEHWPTNVDWLLARSALCFIDHTGLTPHTEVLLNAPTQEELVTQQHPTARDDTGNPVSSYGTRSTRKRLTYYLADVASADASGSPNPGDWTTYLHTYPNDIGGTTLQYWRLYAMNAGLKLGALPAVVATSAALSLTVGFHGGDWEGIHVELDAALEPQRIRLLRHRDILDRPWSAVELEESTHPRVYVQRGGHSSDLSGVEGGVRQQTWGADQGAVVVRPDGTQNPAGALLDVGSKLAPANEQVFTRYSGLWGSPSRFPLAGSQIHYISSGYWGPAYNETEMGPDGFIAAWGQGTRDPLMEVAGIREYYATSTCP